MILALALFACTPDDVTDEPKDTAGDTADTDTDPSTGPGDIHDAWVSEGDDISVLFSAPPFAYVRIEATFNADASYVVTTTDGEGATADLTGTFVTDDSTNPGTITLTQATPYDATAVGIWQVERDTLSYEVVQTLPDYGFVPPTPDTGFGSTSGPGVAADSNVQIYQRM
ncbi:MAG: hypothetical protein Q8P41_02820 [Pseudomonadota bacterium]|nr:hypothetical protein [Pseudomonadota bacterium]